MSGWPVASLGDVAAFGSGGTPKREERAYYGGNIPWAMIGDLTNGPIYRTAESITPEGLSASSAKLIPSGSVLIAMYGASIGKLGLPEVEMATNQAIAFLTPHDGKLDRQYLFQYLRSQRPALSAAGSGGAQPNISQTVLKAWKIPLPPIAEQRRIAAILDHADTTRAKRREALAGLDELTQSIFIDMFGPGEIDNRDECPLGDRLAFLTSGSRGWAKYYSDAGDLFIRIQNVGYDQMRLGDVAYVRPPATAEARRTKVQVGDVLLSITADLGRTAVVNDAAAGGYINQHLAILRSNVYEPAYLSRYLSSPAGQRQISSKSRGGTKAGLNFDDVRSLRVPCPPLNEQRTFAQRAHTVQHLRAKHRAALAELDTLFASLQSRAFRGEL